MATVRNAMDQVVTLIEGTTPDSPSFDRAPEFRHASKTYDPEDLADNQSPSRRFVVGLTGSRRATGPMGSAMSPIYIEQTLEAVVLYRSPSDAWELARVVGEDVDRLAWRLTQPALWDTPTSGLINIQVGDYSVDLGQQANDTAIVSIPITITYKPSYTG